MCRTEANKSKKWWIHRLYCRYNCEFHNSLLIHSLFSQLLFLPNVMLSEAFHVGVFYQQGKRKYWSKCLKAFFIPAFLLELTGTPCIMEDSVARSFSDNSRDDFMWAVSAAWFRSWTSLISEHHCRSLVGKNC